MIDGRLLGPAVGAWLGAAATGVLLDATADGVTRHGLSLTLLWLLTGMLAALLAIGWLGRRWTGPRPGPGVMTAGFVAASFVLVGAIACCLGTLRLTVPPVAGWADSRVTATVVGIVSEEPRTRQSGLPGTWRAATWTEVRLTTDTVAARGASAQVRVPILVKLTTGVSVPPPGARIRVVGRLAPATSDVAASLVVPARSDITILDPPDPLRTLTHAMRVGLRDSVAGVPADAGALVAGLAVGDESLASPELTEAMRASGLSHLTAVSGGNVAIVLGLVVAVAALLRLRLWIRVACGLAALAFFALLVGAQPSVLRACVMGAVATVGVLAGGRRGGPSVLAAGVLVLLIVSPWLSRSWGFALSAGATAGIILLAPRLQHRLGRWQATARWPPAVVQAVALTTAAQAATWPLLVGMGGAVGWVSLPANLAAMPVVAPITILGLLASATAPILPVVAQASAWAASWPAAWIAMVAHATSDWPMARLPWPQGWAGVLLVAGLVTVLAGARWATRRFGPLPLDARLTAAGTALVIVVALVARPPSLRGWPPPGWLMIMCDVGQGDALLVRVSDGSALVVDAGPDPSAVDDCLTDAGIGTVPAVVLTHFHADHVRGLPGVLRGRDVSAVMASAVREPADEAAWVDQVLAPAGLAVRPMSAGAAADVGPVSWQVLWPRRRIAAGSVPNNASVVLALRSHGRLMLLPGDIEPEAQIAIAADLVGLRFDVVKVPHHGSRYQAEGFPTWARAPIALVSVGADNDYGHPAAETLAAWQVLGAVIARTDRDGDVAVVESGSGLGVVARDGMLPSS